MSAIAPHHHQLCQTIARRLSAALAGDTTARGLLRADLHSLLSETVESSVFTKVSLHLDGLLPEGTARNAARVLLDEAMAEVHDFTIDDKGAVTGHLMALPLLLSAPGQPLHQSLPEALLTRMPALVAERGFVLGASRITILPMLLGAEECSVMTAAEVLKLQELLAAGEPVRAQEFMLALRDKVYPGWRSVESVDQHTSVLGMLVGYAATRADDPFEVSLQLELQADLSHDAAAALEQNLVDAAVDIRALTDWSNLIVPEGADQWSTATDSAQSLDRSLLADATLDGIKEAISLEVGEALAVLEAEETPPTKLPGFELLVCRSRDGSIVGKLNWVQLRSETADDCLSELYDYLAASDVLPVEALGGFAAEGAGTLH